MFSEISARRGCPGETSKGASEKPQREEQGAEGWISWRRKETAWEGSERASLLSRALGRVSVQRRFGPL